MRPHLATGTAIAGAALCARGSNGVDDPTAQQGSQHDSCIAELNGKFVQCLISLGASMAGTVIAAVAAVEVHCAPCTSSMPPLVDEALFFGGSAWAALEATSRLLAPTELDAKFETTSREFCKNAADFLQTDALPRWIDAGVAGSPEDAALAADVKSTTAPDVYAFSSTSKSPSKASSRPMSLGNAVRRVVVRGADCVRPGGATNAAAVAARAHRSRMLPIAAGWLKAMLGAHCCRTR